MHMCQIKQSIVRPIDLIHTLNWAYLIRISVRVRVQMCTATSNKAERPHAQRPHAIKMHRRYMISMSRPIYVDSRSANKNETKYPRLPRNKLLSNVWLWLLCVHVRRHNHSLNRHFNVRIRQSQRHTHLINYCIFANHMHFSTHTHTHTRGDIDPVK